MISRCFAVGLALGLAGLVGCAQDGAADDAETASASSDLSSQHPRLLGTIQPGETKLDSLYYPPQPRAWAFTAEPGSTITVDVMSYAGDAFAYLTDDRYNVISYNDDRDVSTRNSEIVYRVPATSTVNTFRIVFVDLHAHPAHFDVSLRIAAGLTCTVGSATYHEGDRIPSGDSCNTCTCTAAGVSCTKNICSCDDAKSDPHKIYKYSPEDCAFTAPVCTGSWHPFSDECGCGCAQN